VASPAASNSPQTLNITLTVTPRAAGNVIAVQNGASFVPTAVSPGQIITLRGNGIGPATGVEFRLTSAGTVPTTVGDTRVLFDGIPAAVLYASATQVNAIVPYEITGRFSTRLQVEFLGTVSNTVDLLVVDTAPGIFTAGSQGSGQSAALNQDGTVNSATNPATKGSVIVLFATGEGQTNPAGVTASVSSASNLKRPLQNVTVTIGGRQAQVQYAGSAPGLVAGALQVNAVIPEDTPSGPAAVVLTIGNSSSQPGVTIAVR
jgi:uncharacterized protein (TIGR03437 family)